jgi:hypothetical protein
MNILQVSKELVGTWQWIPEENQVPQDPIRAVLVQSEGQSDSGLSTAGSFNRPLGFDLICIRHEIQVELNRSEIFLGQ